MSSVVVIGAGLGGLMAGNLLAKKGHKVTVFESHSAPGGYTAGFRRKGYYFESGTLSFEMSDLVFGAMKDIGVFDKLTFTRQIARWVSNDYDFIMRSLDDMKKALLEAFPAERKRLRTYYAEIDRVSRLYGKMEKPKSMFGRIVFPFHVARFANMARKYGRMTSSEFVEKYFDKGSKLYCLFRDAGYPEMSAMIVPAAYSSLFNDYWTVKTGMQSWADVLAENFKKLGGELKLQSRVDKILTKNGSAVGVTCSGKDYEADYVLSASDYKKTFLNLLDDRSLLSNDFIEKLKNAAVSESFFVVYLGLNITPKIMKEYLKVPHVLYDASRAPGLDMSDANDEKLFEKVWLNVYSPSLVNEELAPKGKSSLMISCMVPPRWMKNWGDGDRKVYKQLKESVKKTLIMRTSGLIPDIEKHIEFEDAATPLTYERYTGNTEGASSAWSWNPKKWYYQNPGSTTVDTPVKNLYISSCWAYEFGGIPTAINAAYLCSKKIQ
ncbi:MAG: NAD(P)/FAD-dependent oxidoreductase [candidate division WOR-3 bacterium]|nr:MAG: NAD(P)/FAD-dependent oxidoreductase [candidate division WOR-3 bacterium]